MIGDQVRRYLVAVRTDEGAGDALFGPYTRRKAEQLAEQFNDRIDESEFGFVHAIALPIDNPQSVKQLLKEFGQ